MGNLKKLKFQMKMDHNLRHTLVKGTRNEILIDLDGDKQPDIALMDQTGNGNIDTICVDLNGDGEFNVYLMDTDDNKIPDSILIDKNGDGSLERLACGEEVEKAVTFAAAAVFKAIELGEYVSEVLDEALDELQKELKRLAKSRK